MVDSKISFLPFINYLKDKLTVVPIPKPGFYHYLIEKLEAEPALLEPIEDHTLLNQNQGLLELLGTVLFPVDQCNEEKNMFTMAVPYQFSVFNYSTAFRNIFVDPEETHVSVAGRCY